MKVGDKVIITRHGPWKGRVFKAAPTSLPGIATGTKKGAAVSASKLPSGSYIEIQVGEGEQFYRGRPCPK